MKKKNFLLTIISTLLAVTVATTMIISCATAGSNGVTGLILFTNPVVAWLTSGGSINHDDLQNPISGGTEITDATVIATNEDQENSISLTYVPGGFDGDMGLYAGITEFSHASGENVTVSITTGSNQYNGASTQTPDSSTIITYPVEYKNEQPFPLIWGVTTGDYPATHTIVQIMNDDPYVNKWYVLPIEQTSYQISGLPVDSSYAMGAFQCNEMIFSGGGQIIGYLPAAASITYIFVNITK